MPNDPRWIVMEHLARIVMIQERVQIESPQQLVALEKRFDALFSAAEPVPGLGMLIEQNVKGARGRVLNPLSWKDRPIATILRGAVAFADQVAIEVCEPLTNARTRTGVPRSGAAVGPPPVALPPLPHIGSPAVSAWERPLQQRLFDNTHAGRVVFDEIDNHDLTTESRELQLFVTWLVLRLGFAPNDVEKVQNPEACARDIAANIRSYLDGMAGAGRFAHVAWMPPFTPARPPGAAPAPQPEQGAMAGASKPEANSEGITPGAGFVMLLVGLALPVALLTWLYLTPVGAAGSAIAHTSDVLHVREPEQ